MHFVTKAMPISNITSKCSKKILKSSRTCLIGYSGFISREWLLGQTLTHTINNLHTYKTKDHNRYCIGVTI